MDDSILGNESVLAKDFYKFSDEITKWDVYESKSSIKSMSQSSSVDSLELDKKLTKAGFEKVEPDQ